MISGFGIAAAGGGVEWSAGIVGILGASKLAGIKKEGNEEGAVTADGVHGVGGWDQPGQPLAQRQSDQEQVQHARLPMLGLIPFGTGKTFRSLSFEHDAEMPLHDLASLFPMAAADTFARWYNSCRPRSGSRLA